MTVILECELLVLDVNVLVFHISRYYHKEFLHHLGGEVIFLHFVLEEALRQKYLRS